MAAGTSHPSPSRFRHLWVLGLAVAAAGHVRVLGLALQIAIFWLAVQLAVFRLAVQLAVFRLALRRVAAAALAALRAQLGALIQDFGTKRSKIPVKISFMYSM